MKQLNYLQLSCKASPCDSLLIYRRAAVGRCSSNHAMQQLHSTGQVASLGHVTFYGHVRRLAQTQYVTSCARVRVCLCPLQSIYIDINEVDTRM